MYRDGVQELPDVPQNAALLEYLREQASPPSGPDDYTLGPWQLRSHPNLITALSRPKTTRLPNGCHSPATAGTASARCKTGSRRAARRTRKAPARKCQVTGE